MAKLIDKIAVVTGGGSGIGLASAKLFAQEGAQVVIVGRTKAALEQAAVDIGNNAVAIVADVSDLDALDALYAEVGKRFGRIDVIFANAGGGSFAPLGAISEEHYQQTFDTNVKGVLFTVQKALPLLRDGASVILTSSVTAITGTAAFSVYSATKAAVRNFARSWILDLKDRRIRVNAVSPGPIETAGLVELAGPDAAAQQGLLDFMAGQVPLGRVGQPEEIAKAVLFLASDQASFVNGIELFVDGGMAQI